MKDFKVGDVSLERRVCVVLKTRASLWQNCDDGGRASGALIPNKAGGSPAITEYRARKVWRAPFNVCVDALQEASQLCAGSCVWQYQAPFHHDRSSCKHWLHGPEVVLLN